MVGYEALRAEQQRLRAQGRYLGIGLASYIEICGIGPSFLLPPGMGGWESCSMRVEPTGMVTVLTGVSPHGQGSETTYAQLVADALGVPLDHIEVMHGNTDVVPYGIGTFGSRSLAVGGAAVQMSVEKIKAKARQLAAYMLDVQPEDVTYGDGAIYVTADPSRQTTLAEVAFAATDFNWQPQGGAPAGLEPGLEATSRFEPTNGTCPFGTHMCVVEIDPDRSSPVIWTQFSFYLPIHQSLTALLGGRCCCLHCPLDGRGTCKAWRIRVCCASGRGRRVTLEVSSKG